MGPSSLHSQTADPDAIGKELLQRMYNSDGLPEITVGLFFLLFAGLNYLIAVLPAQSAGCKVATLGLVFWPLFLLGSRPALTWVRTRYLLERFGYVQYKPIFSNLKQTGPRMVLILLATILAAVILGFLTGRLQLPSWPRWLLGGTGLFGGAICVAIGRPRRMVLYGLLMAATGLSLALWGVPAASGTAAWLSFRMRLAILFGLQGLVTLVAGVLVFLRFLRQPIPAGE